MLLKHLYLACSLLAPLTLSSQEPPSRVGLQAGLVMPQGDIEGKVGQGYALGLSIHFNREATHEGRLRIELIEMGEKTRTEPDPYLTPGPVTATRDVKRSMHAVSVGYDWMPGNGRVRAILGLGGMLWHQEAEATNAYGQTTPQNAAGIAMVPTLGLRVRFNRHVALEARFSPARNNLASDQESLNTEMNHIVVGFEIRF